MTALPGLPGSPAPAGDDWMPREVRALRQQVEQLRGQIAQLSAALAGAVTAVDVSGSTLTVTHGDGSQDTYTLP